jgi:GTP-binding protein
MAQLNINNAEFIKSAASPSGFIRDELPNIVFSGKSNVGKSSVINRLLNRKNFARVGQSPGKTIHVNYFLIDRKVYFVDLPGYGYAKMSKSERERWGKLMEQFFAAEGLIDLGVMIVDSRHKPTADDVTMAQWFKSTECPLVVVANKCDKLKKSEIEPNLELIRQTLELDQSVPLILFSAEKGIGRDALMARILEYV